MTGGIFEESAGATPLDPDSARGLIPTWIATRSDLNVAEQENILSAMQWAFVERGRWTPDGLLDEDIMRDLHRRMFGEVWRWAGDYRCAPTNIGVPVHAIGRDVRNLLADVRAQLTDETRPWSDGEIAVRFHHRLVSIHPFANGNGRHARFAADLLVVSLGRPRFTWGDGRDMQASQPTRERYLEALRAADSGDPANLLEFARS